MAVTPINRQTILVFVLVTVLFSNAEACPSCDHLNRKQGARTNPPYDCCGGCKDGYERFNMHYNSPHYYTCRQEIDLPTTSTAKAVTAQLASPTNPTVPAEVIWIILGLVATSVLLIPVILGMYCYFRQELTYDNFEKYVAKLISSFPAKHQNNLNSSVDYPLLPVGQTEENHVNSDAAPRVNNCDTPTSESTAVRLTIDEPGDES